MPVRFVRKPLFVGLSGPDGAGKSTIAQALASSLIETGYSAITLHFTGAFIFSVAGRRIGLTLAYDLIRRKAIADRQRPHFESIFLFQLSRSLISLIDYTCWMVWRVQRQIKGYDVVILDRTPLDIAECICPTTEGLKGVTRILALTPPRPQITFILLARPETIASRRNDLSQEEVALRLQKYEVLAVVTRSSTIHTDLPLDLTSREAFIHVMATLNKAVVNRNRQRLLEDGTRDNTTR